MGTYFSPDGDYRKYGVTKAVPNTAGEYKTYGDRRSIEVKIDLTTLTTSNVIQSDQLFFPKTARIEQVVITGLTAAATSSSALLNVGLVSTADRTTEVDFDGILAAATTAQMTAGIQTTLTKGGSNVGALVGSGSVASSIPAHITAATTTGTYTAGLINLRIDYFVP